MYHEALGALPGIGFQLVRSGDRNSYKDFSFTVDPQAFGLGRDDLVKALTAENIDVRKYYDPPVHRQVAYLHLYAGQPLPNTDWLAASSLSLPIWSDMPEETALKICQAIQNIQANSRAIREKVVERT